MRHLLIVSTLVLGVLVGFPGTGTGAIYTKKLASGQVVVGGRDGATRFRSSNSATSALAFIVAPFTDWVAPMPGSRWISFNATSASPLPYPQRSRYLFEATFALPATFHAPSLVVNVLADNSAAVYLNGYRIGGQPCCAFSNFKTPSTYADHTLAHFRSGRNSLRIVLGDYGVVGGLDYTATITWSS